LIGASIISIIFSGNTGKIMAAQWSIMKGCFPDGILAPPPAGIGPVGDRRRRPALLFLSLGLFSHL
jgi:hypothetical protein